MADAHVFFSTWLSENSTQNSEFEKLAWSLLGSGITITVFYLLYLGVATIRGQKSDLLSGTSLNLQVLAPIYLFVLIIAIGVGIVAGLADNIIIHNGDGLKKGDGWLELARLLHKRAILSTKPESGVTYPVLTVVTNDGDSFEGWPTFIGTNLQDIILVCKSSIAKDGTKTVYEENKCIYLTESSIVRVDTNDELYPNGSEVEATIEGEEPIEPETSSD